jgi:predicted RecB family nuclease
VWFNDALQLAHYRRMLEEHGIGAADDLLGGILDGSGTVWWLPLEVAQPGIAVSVVDAYDQRFAELIALAGDARAWDADRSLTRPRSPWWHKECERCPYEEACHGELEEVDDVSLVRWMSEPTLARLRSVGVTTRTDLAGLDLSLVDLAHRLAETSLPLPDLLVELESHGSEASMDDIAGARLGARRRLAAAGIEVPSDLLDRDPTSLEVAGTIPDLGRLIRRARAHQAGGVIRQVPADQITGARADVEVDIDMESYEHATYLWGALVTTWGAWAYLAWQVCCSAHGGLR